MISSHATAASTLFSDAQSSGATAQINSIISANASALADFGTSFTDAQLQTIYTSVLPMLPGITEGDVDLALGYLTVPGGTAQSLSSQGVVPQQNSFLALLGQAASNLNGGVITASEGIQRRKSVPHLREVGCSGYYAAMFLFGVAAFLTDGLSAGVFWGVEVTWSQIFGGLGLIGGGIGKSVGC